MRNRRKFFAGTCWNDGRRNLNEDAIVYLKIAAEDISGSCNPTAYYGYLDLCGDRLYLRLGAGAYQHGGCFAGCGSPDYLLPAKRHYPVGDSISYQPLWPADGGDLATGQGSGFSVLSTRHNLWISCRAPFDEVCKSADQMELLIFLLTKSSDRSWLYPYILKIALKNAILLNWTK